MTIDGPVVLDIVQHFTERWNEVKRRKVSNFIPKNYLVTL
jgi:phospholipase D1/2